MMNNAGKPGWRDWMPRIKLRTLLICSPLLACLLVYLINSYHIIQMQAKLKMMYQLADELQVLDPNLVVARRTIDSDDEVIDWQVYVPSHARWVLKLSTTPPPDSSGFTVSPVSDMQFGLPPGMMELRLRVERVGSDTRLVLNREEECLGVCEKPTRELSGGTISLATLSEASRHFSTFEIPILLHREYVGIGNTKSQHGIFVWIEKDLSDHK